MKVRLISGHFGTGKKDINSLYFDKVIDKDEHGISSELDCLPEWLMRRRCLIGSRFAA